MNRFLCKVKRLFFERIPDQEGREREKLTQMQDAAQLKSSIVLIQKKEEEEEEENVCQLTLTWNANHTNFKDGLMYMCMYIYV